MPRGQRGAALVFPGIGYRFERPLLAAGERLASSLGYELLEVSYDGFERGIRGNPEAIRRAIRMACEKSEAILSGVKMESYPEILMISKSVGTVAAASYLSGHLGELPRGAKIRSLYFTPLAETFDYAPKGIGLVFHGTADPWARTEAVTKGCKERNLPLVQVEGGNHSLECGTAARDKEVLSRVTRLCELYLRDTLEAGEVRWV
jgi:hypothetical protein